jgi:hypothetical protein
MGHPRGTWVVTLYFACCNSQKFWSWGRKFYSLGVRYGSQLLGVRSYGATSDLNLRDQSRELHNYDT